MTQLPIGIIALFIVSALIYFGLAQRVLDKLYLTDRAAIGILVLMAIGSFINLPITNGRYDVSINLGGALIPLGIAIYVLTRAGTAKEWIRALFAALITGGIIFGVGHYMFWGNAEPGGGFFGYLDSLWVYPIIGGLIAYIAGRSRRSAFIAATLGLVLVDVAYWVQLYYTGAPNGRVAIGGAGAFDGIVLAGIMAVLLAEVIGEIRERLQGGPVTEGRPRELLEALRKPGEQFGRNKQDDGSEQDKCERNIWYKEDEREGDQR